MYEIEAKNIKKSFGNLEVLKSISLQVNKGEVVAILGSSGSGKSTFLRCLNYLESINKGEITIYNDVLKGGSGTVVRKHNETTAKKIRQNVGMVFQQFNLLESKTVYHNIALPLILEKAPKEEIEKKVKEVLRFVELEDKKDVYVSQLSGGQKQRVAIARALMQKPDIILADEPVASLDPYSAEQITDILVKLNRQYNITVIMNSHSVELALKKSDRIIGIVDGRLVLDKKSSEVTDENIEFIYGGTYEKHE